MVRKYLHSLQQSQSHNIGSIVHLMAMTKCVYPCGLRAHHCASQGLSRLHHQEPLNHGYYHLNNLGSMLWFCNFHF